MSGLDVSRGGLNMGSRDAAIDVGAAAVTRSYPHSPSAVGRRLDATQVLDAAHEAGLFVWTDEECEHRFALARCLCPYGCGGGGIGNYAAEVRRRGGDAVPES